MNQSRVVMTNHRRDLTDSAQNDVSHENHLAGVLIPATPPGNQHGALLEEDDQCGQIVRATLTAQRVKLVTFSFVKLALR